MRMRGIIGVASVIGVAVVAVVRAHEHDVPAGPIRDRHELMEGIGKNAKIIGDALKAGNTAPVAEAAEKIKTAAPKIPALFPPGSTHPKSRAKPAIWKQWPKFEEQTKKLEANAGALADAAKSHGDVKVATDNLFGTCKSCHDDFRVPEKKKAKK